MLKQTFVRRDYFKAWAEKPQQIIKYQKHDILKNVFFYKEIFKNELEYSLHGTFGRVAGLASKNNYIDND